MDVLRKELNEVYQRQCLDREDLDKKIVDATLRNVETMSHIGKMCAVVTDIAHNRSWLFPSLLGDRLGIRCDAPWHRLDSSDEDIIYRLMHPEDLVGKRMLEYRFFLDVENLTPHDIPERKAACTIRISDPDGNYIPVDNTTQILQLSPSGKMWLILCTYRFSECNTPSYKNSTPSYKNSAPSYDINARIINERTGDITPYSFNEQRMSILSNREKEVLALIREGLLSKEIAERLCISVNTVSRHRQNILEKLCVDNSMEAVNAAIAAKLL